MITIRPLTPNFGGEVVGLDYSQLEDEGVTRRLEYLWLRHSLLLFRGLDAEDEENLVRLSRVFGQLEIHGRTEYLSPKTPELLYVSNIRKGDRAIGILGDGEAGWHHDQSYLPRPAMGSLLAAHTVPAQGGNTSFADMAGAYEALPQSMKGRIEGLTALHSYAHFNAQYSEPANENQRKRQTDVVHPVVRQHPLTGRKALYVSPGVTVRIVGIPEDESAALLRELHAWATRPEFVYEHRWSIGDGVLWDNACTIHRREPFDPEQRRLMKRTTIRPPESLAVPV